MSEVKFERENRYIVIKRSDLEKVPVAYRSSLIEPIGALQAHLPHRECLVIESDWPEYEPTWKAIEDRVSGKQAEFVPDAVKRFLVSDLYVACCGDTIVVNAEDFDAQRLRADTAEAELAKANDKIDKAWRRSHEIDDKACIPGAFDAWKRPVPQFLPYDFSGNPGTSAIQYCNGWNDSGGYWSAHANEVVAKLAAAEQRIAELVELLCEVSKLAGDHMSHQSWNLKTQLENIHQMIDAALNQESEGESQ